MIADLDSTLKQLLVKRIPLDPNEVDIAFECPKREWSAKVIKPTINLYLFDLREHTELRSGQWIQQNTEGVRTGRLFPPVFVDLSYFITTWAQEVADEHLLLWRTMAALFREPVIGADLLQGALREEGPPMRTQTAQAEGVLRNPGEFWSALDNDLKPAVVYTATLRVDLNILIELPLVFNRRVTIGDMTGARMRPVLGVGGTVRAKGTGKKGQAREVVPNAHVVFPNLGIDVRSNEEGRFVIPDMPIGRHRVRIATLAGKESETEMEVPSQTYDLEV